MQESARGLIFDVDGVLVDSPHEHAWRESLRELMEGDWRDLRARTSWSPDGFTSHVYQELVAGKPRMDGARAALDHFAVPDAAQRADEYAERKQAMVERLIDAGAFTSFDDAIRLVLAAREARMRVATASSSKNAGAFLRRVPIGDGRTLADAFDADVSGRPFPHGKPHPDMFLAAAQELEVPPARAVVVEDAVSGIQAAKAGGMGAIAVARADDADMLAAAGADLVVATLDDVDVVSLTQGRIAVRGATR